MSNVEEVTSSSFLIEFKEAAVATKSNASIIELKLKGASKRVSNQIEMESPAAISGIQSKLERDDSKVLQNGATWHAVLHSFVAEGCRIL